LDYCIFTYTFSSTELARRKASLIACCVIESPANIEDVDSNTLRVIVSRAFGGWGIPYSTLTAIYAQLVVTINRPMSSLSLTEKEKAILENWYNLGNRKSLTNALSNGGDDTSPNVELVEVVTKTHVEPLLLVSIPKYVGSNASGFLPLFRFLLFSGSIKRFRLKEAGSH
jgi:hypothetical protein